MSKMIQGHKLFLFIQCIDFDTSEPVVTCFVSYDTDCKKFLLVGKNTRCSDAEEFKLFYKEAINALEYLQTICIAKDMIFNVALYNMNDNMNDIIDEDDEVFEQLCDYFDPKTKITSYTTADYGYGALSNEEIWKIITKNFNIINQG